MDFFADCQRPGNFLGHFYEIVPWIYPAPLYGADRWGGDCKFPVLARATKVLPLGTAYAIWTGIGAVGSVVVGIVFFQEPATALRIFFIGMLMVGILGLKLTSEH